MMWIVRLALRRPISVAVMAHCCGGSVQRVIFGRNIFGENYGRSFWAVPDLDKYLLVLSAGVLALYLRERPSGTEFQSFIEWVSTTDGYTMAMSGASDWAEILRLTEQPRGYGMDDFLERAVRPYFDEAVGLLANARDRFAGLTEVILAQPPGLGHRSLNASSRVTDATALPTGLIARVSFGQRSRSAVWGIPLIVKTCRLAHTRP